MVTSLEFSNRLIFERDNLHTKAGELSADFADATIVTTEMVLTELLNHVSV